jgi:hypothetical protein
MRKSTSAGEIEKREYCASFEIFAAAQLRILFVWDMTPRQWAILSN